MTPNNILQYSIDSGLVQSAPEKFSPAVDENKYRNPRPDSTQREQNKQLLRVDLTPCRR